MASGEAASIPLQDSEHGPVYLQFIGCGTADTAASMQIVFPSHRILVNCGEGTQRLFNETRQKLSRVSRILLTQLQWQTIGGLPGALLTMADAGGSSQSKSYDIVGPPKTHQFMAATHAFVWRPDVTLNLFEIGSTPLELPERGMTIEPVLLVAEADTSRLVPSRAVSRPAVSVRPASDEVDATAAEPAAKLARACEHTADVASAAGEVDRTPLHSAVCYILRLPEERGKFNPQRAMALGVPRGPAFGSLQRGQSVTLPSGVVVAPSDVMAPPTPGPVVLLIDCPTAALLPALLTAPQLAALASSPAVVVHFSPPHVLALPEYAAFAAAFGAQSLQVYANAAVATDRIHFQSAARQAATLHCLDPLMFPAPCIAAAAAGEAARAAAVLGPAGVAAAPLLRVHLRPAASLRIDTADVPPPTLPLTEAPELVIRALTARGMAAPTPSALRPDDGAGRRAAHVTIEFLGTGCAIPSKYRNVSATLVRGAEGLSVMLDAGEGTLGQMQRRFGAETAAVLATLRVVFVSHMHADHHLGVPGLLAEIARLGLPPPLVVGPRQFIKWLVAYSAIEAVPHTAFANSEFTRDDAVLPDALRTAGLASLHTVPVLHSRDSYAVVIAGAAGWRVAFSGDCRPSQALATAGAGADVCIHEATFEDELADEAAAKNHATTAEALQVGLQMEARCVALNHFSQRYPAIPAVSADAAGRAVIAFDLMSLALPADTAVFAALEAAVRAVLETAADEADEAETAEA